MFRGGKSWFGKEHEGRETSSLRLIQTSAGEQCAMVEIMPITHSSGANEAAHVSSRQMICPRAQLSRRMPTIWRSAIYATQMLSQFPQGPRDFRIAAGCPTTPAPPHVIAWSIIDWRWPPVSLKEEWRAVALQTQNASARVFRNTESHASGFENEALDARLESRGTCVASSRATPFRSESPCRSWFATTTSIRHFAC